MDYHQNDKLLSIKMRLENIKRHLEFIIEMIANLDESIKLLN
jgi:hypothetical protein